MPPIPTVNIASPTFKADPYPFYARLRSEAPVHPIRLPDGHRAWLVTRYDDVVTVLKDDRFAKDKLNAMTPAQLGKAPWVPRPFQPLVRNMLDVDPPDHTRLRALVSTGFTSRLVENLRPRIQRITDQLLDAIRPKGRTDLIHDFALPLPATIIAELLGVPSSDMHRFHRWSRALLAGTTTDIGKVLAIPSVLGFLRYIRKMADTRREEPRDDLISVLVRAEEAGDHLREDELVAMMVLLLIAGHETTVNLVGNGTLALLRHPEQLNRLKQDPGLIKSAIEELLRFEPPVETATERYPRDDVTIAGVTIPRGEMVLPAIASAHRDERQFPDPDALDLSREPNRHVAFGLGIHYCLGAPLARLEGQIAINTLLARLPELRLAVPERALRWKGGLVLRGLRALPLEFSC